MADTICKRELNIDNDRVLEKYLSKNKLDKAYRKDFEYIPTLLKYYQYYIAFVFLF